MFAFTAFGRKSLALYTNSVKSQLTGMMAFAIVCLVERQRETVTKSAAMRGRNLKKD
jgi:hypothetical protein